MTLDYIYHVGHLAVDRNERIGRLVGLRLNPCLGPLTEMAEKLEERAAALHLAARKGKVHLFQRRVPDGFEYHCRAIKGA